MSGSWPRQGQEADVGDILIRNGRKPTRGMQLLCGLSSYLLLCREVMTGAQQLRTP